MKRTVPQSKAARKAAKVARRDLDARSARAWASVAPRGLAMRCTECFLTDCQCADRQQADDERRVAEPMQAPRKWHGLDAQSAFVHAIRWENDTMEAQPSPGAYAPVWDGQDWR